MSRRTWATAAAVVAAALAVTGGVIVGTGDEPATPAAQAAGTADAATAFTATVREGALSSAVSLTGILTYRAQTDGTPFSAINRASGIYTALPAAGAAVDCGDVLYRVDDEPVLLLCGPVPAYRDLAIGDEGRDVRQLNRNLRRLGHDEAPAGDEFTWRTREALERLQRARGFDEPTGELDLDDAVVLPRAARVAEVKGKLGGSARAGAEVARLTSETLEVQVELEPSQQRVVRRGDRARIVLPDNTTVRGTVARVGRVATAAEDDGRPGPATIPASIRLAQPRKARGLDRAPVQVEITTAGVERALSVPVTALVGKAGGGFAVEVVRPGGARELVEVELGLFDSAGGRVQVDGDLRAGDRVGIPSL